MTLPEWKLPPGVARGTWDYANSTLVAEDYDDYHALNPLFEFEESILAEEFNPPGVVADFGCGTGRALVPLVRRGCRGIAVDLSEKMLAIVREKAGLEGLAIECVQANLVELDALASESADYGMCLFSTLGMIRGRKNRAAALAHMRRVLRPGGRVIVPTFCHDETRISWLVSRLLAVTGFPGHRRFTVQSLNGALEDAGLAMDLSESLPGLIPIGYAQGRRPA